MGNNIKELLDLVKNASATVVFSVLLDFKKDAGDTSIVLSKVELEEETYSQSVLPDLEHLKKLDLISFDKVFRPRLKTTEFVITVNSEIKEPVVETVAESVVETIEEAVEETDSGDVVVPWKKGKKK